jgi:hypothetical protein
MQAVLCRTFHALVILLCFSYAANAQVATGIYNYGTYDTPGIDTINVGNLNVHLGIPILNKAGRGISFSYTLGYDSSVWYPSDVNGTSTWTPVQNFGWAGDTQTATGYMSFDVSTVTGPVHESGGLQYTCPTTFYQAFVYYDTFGAKHPFAGTTIDTSQQPCRPNNQLHLYGHRRIRADP